MLQTLSRFLSKKNVVETNLSFNSSLRRSQGNHFLRTWLPTERSSPHWRPPRQPLLVLHRPEHRTSGARRGPRRRKQDWTSVCTLLGVSVGACLALALNRQVYNFWEVQRHSRLFYFQTKNITIFCRHSDYSQPECSQLSWLILHVDRHNNCFYVLPNSLAEQNGRFIFSRLFQDPSSINWI